MPTESWRGICWRKRQMNDRPVNSRSMRSKLLLYFGPLLLVLLMAASGTLWMVQSMLGKAGAGQQEQWQNLRWIVLSLALVFVLEINIAVVLILRMAVAVVRPIEKLV